MKDLGRAVGKMKGFVEAHVAAAKPSQVFGMGYSNGANILAATLFAAPDLFDADDEGYAVVLETGDLTDEQVAQAQLAADNCPEYAITVQA